MRFILTAAIACLLAVPSYAAELNTSSPWYFGIQGGATILMDADNQDSGTSFSVESQADTGFAVGGMGGYRFKNGIRVEGEVTYRRNSLDTLEVTNDAGLGTALGVGSLNGLTLDADGDVSSVAFMANLWFEPQVGNGLLPYIGGGVGGVYVSADASAAGVKIVDDNDTVFAGQVGAGIGYAVTSNVVVSADYRFLMSADPTFKDTAGFSFDSEYMTHNIMVGVRGNF